MTKDGFNWKPETWPQGYVKHFQEIKDTTQNTTTIHFLNYDMDSNIAVGAGKWDSFTRTEGFRRKINFASHWICVAKIYCLGC